jgi:succinate dehydrogenase / fumarate reductase iron-sulfur subunit
MSHRNEPTDERGRHFVFRIFRFAAGQNDEPHFDTFELDVIPGTTVLAGLLRIQQEQDPSLAFRFACRGAVCGSCGMVINGACGLACRTQLWPMVGEEVVLEPLPHLDVIRDLIVDMTPFWTKYRRVRPWLHNGFVPSQDRPSSPVPGPASLPATDAAPLVREQLQSPRDFRRIEQYTNCVLCACCYGACPVIKRQPDYLGPAAVAKLLRFVDDSRDSRPAALIRDVDNEEQGVWGCDTVFRCIDACPRDVRPTDGVSALRRRLISQRLRRVT